MCYSTTEYLKRALTSQEQGKKYIDLFEQDRKYAIAAEKEALKYAEKEAKKAQTLKGEKQQWAVESAEMWADDARQEARYIEEFDAAIAKIKEKYPELTEEAIKKAEKAAARKHDRELKKAEATLKESQEALEISKARHPSSQGEQVPEKESRKRKMARIR